MILRHPFGSLDTSAYGVLGYPQLSSGQGVVNLVDEEFLARPVGLSGLYSYRWEVPIGDKEAGPDNVPPLFPVWDSGGWRREWDSNPRSRVNRTRDFQSRPLGHSGISPKTRRRPESAGRRARRPRAGGGEGGIRTHDEIAPIPVFETGALSRSATSPNSKIIA